jgi:hypothetical protein
VTVFGLVLTPVFYVVVRKLALRREARHAWRHDRPAHDGQEDIRHENIFRIHTTRQDAGAARPRGGVDWLLHGTEV